MINLIGIIGGLGLFLLGMSLLSNGLVKLGSESLKKILHTLTKKKIIAIILGCLVTSFIQSSSATSLILIGLLRGKYISLKQAMWVMIGANIGTTTTGYLLSIDLKGLAPIFCVIGIVLFLLHQDILHKLGIIFMGFGSIFVALELMTYSMSFINQTEAFSYALSQINVPGIAFLFGLLLTALMQSSSVTLGMLQVMLREGVVYVGNAIYALLGMNIGTCFTVILGSINSNKDVKFLCLFHCLFNIIGVMIFALWCALFGSQSLLSIVPNAIPSIQIVYVHTLFNIVVAIVLYKLDDFVLKFYK